MIARMVLLALVLPACTAQDAQAWQAFSQAYAANLRAQQEAQQQDAAPPCNSNFDCSARRYGDVCVKQHMSFQGVCMTRTNQWGTPILATPPNNNVGVMGSINGGCHFNTQCPVAWRCDTSTGACVR